MHTDALPWWWPDLLLLRLLVWSWRPTVSPRPAGESQHLFESGSLPVLRRMQLPHRLPLRVGHLLTRAHRRLQKWNIDRHSLQLKEHLHISYSSSINLYTFMHSLNILRNISHMWDVLRSYDPPSLPIGRAGSSNMWAICSVLVLVHIASCDRVGRNTAHTYRSIQHCMRCYSAITGTTWHVNLWTTRVQTYWLHYENTTQRNSFILCTVYLINL